MYLKLSFLSEIIFRLQVALENSVFQNAIHYFIFRNACFTYRCTVNLLTVTADRIVRVFNISGATQVVVLDISKASYRVWHTGLLYKFKLNGVMKSVFSY